MGNSRRIAVVGAGLLILVLLLLLVWWDDPEVTGEAPAPPVEAALR